MEKTAILMELKNHFLRLYHISSTNKKSNRLEMQLLYQFAAERGISKSELDNFLTDHAREIIIPKRLASKIEFLYDFAQMIWADEVITDEQKNAMKKYIRKLKFLDDNIDELSSYLQRTSK